jgi:hypothetical protein
VKEKILISHAKQILNKFCTLSALREMNCTEHGKGKKRLVL